MFVDERVCVSVIIILNQIDVLFADFLFWYHRLLGSEDFGNGSSGI